MQSQEELGVCLIRRSPIALREINEQIVSDLAKSIKAKGLLQPILVRPTDASYEVVFGHHRLEACKRLGWKSIPAFVKPMSLDESFLTEVAENIQRNVEINPLREAQGYIMLIDHGWTMNAIASQVGKSDSYVSDRIGLIRRLHPRVAGKIKESNKGHLKPSHGELLARLKSKHYQLELSRIVEHRRLSVRELERMITGDQPLRETVERKGESLYVRLPPGIVEHMRIEAGDSVYVFIQSRKRIGIEPIPIQELHPIVSRLV